MHSCIVLDDRTAKQKRIITKAQRPIHWAESSEDRLQMERLDFVAGRSSVFYPGCFDERVVYMTGLEASRLHRSI